MATNQNTSNLTDSHRWTLYKLILRAVVKNLEDEVAKPEEDLLIDPWAKYFRYTHQIETLMELVRLMPTQRYADIISEAMLRRSTLMIRLNFVVEWEPPAIRNWWNWDGLRTLADEAGLCDNSGLYS